MTVTRYSIVRYVPDPIREEPINIGIIAVTDDGGFWGSRFLQDWSRIRSVARRDLSYLKDVIRDLADQTDLQASFDDRQPFTVARLEHLVANWTNSVQFSGMRASVAEPQVLLDRLYRRMVDPGGVQRRRARDKRVAVREAADALRAALAEKYLSHIPSVIPKATVTGKIDLHPMDLTVQNGRLLLGADAISFEVPATTDLDNEARAIAWTCADVRAAHPELPLCVLVLPPTNGRKDYTEALARYQNLKVPVVEEREIRRWAREIVESLPASVP